MKKGFTLIELLIVIAIIAILALIAIPNFLEAQVRAKVSRAQADMRTVAIALEAYMIDQNAYPVCKGRIPDPDAGDIDKMSGGIHQVWDLTTPIAYLSSVSYSDPFVDNGARDKYGDLGGRDGNPYSYLYVNIRVARELKYVADVGTPVPAAPPKSEWVLMSDGPDRVKGVKLFGRSFWYARCYAYHEWDPTDSNFAPWLYDPTNGTISVGDILRFQNMQRR